MNGTYEDYETAVNETKEQETKEQETQCPRHAADCPVMREYRKAADMGPSVFVTIRDVLGLDPRYQPHRNSDADRCAKLVSKMIKKGVCRRGMSVHGRLTWRFNDDPAYRLALEILALEPVNHEFRFQ